MVDRKLTESISPQRGGYDFTSKGLIAFYAAVAGFAVYELFTSRSFFILFLGIYIYPLKRGMGKCEGKNNRYHGFSGTDRSDRVD